MDGFFVVGPMVGLADVGLFVLRDGAFVVGLYVDGLVDVGIAVDVDVVPVLRW